MLGLADTVVAFEADGSPVSETISAVEDRLGASDATLASAIEFDVPAAAWTGAMVSVRIDARALANVRRLYLLRDDHVPAEIASLRFVENSRVATTDARTGDLPAVVSLPIRIERPCRLRVLVQTDKGWFRQDASIQEVGMAGCGSDSDASRK